MQHSTFIDGTSLGGDGERIALTDPATAQVSAEFAQSSVAQAESAVAVARRAQAAWGSRTPGERSRASGHTGEQLMGQQKRTT